MKTILCYGDSNTWRTIPRWQDSPIPSDRYDEDTRWTQRLAKALGAEYRIIEEGLGGRTTIYDVIGEPEKKEFQRTVYLDKKIQVGWDFKINFKDEYFEPYRHASKKLAKDVEQWIIKNKCGETITKNFVCRQLLNFAKKQGCVKQLAGEKE